MLYSLISFSSVFNRTLMNYYATTFVSKEASLNTGTDPVPERHVMCGILTDMMEKVHIVNEFRYVKWFDSM